MLVSVYDSCSYVNMIYVTVVSSYSCEVGVEWSWSAGDLLTSPSVL